MVKKVKGLSMKALQHPSWCKGVSEGRNKQMFKLEVIKNQLFCTGLCSRLSALGPCFWDSLGLQHQCSPSASVLSEQEQFPFLLSGGSVRPLPSALLLLQLCFMPEA